ncbi:hypothetical protein [Brevundimonas sp. ZS04]|uniref:hypothetical protein n=1 Tax=Brevundimonas sp. ZS04 TaxID=1906854 RepID=UPI00096DF10B|nr:hypothetical protein [Brevundimonas sp. ZS04]OMG57633.1 hypothetical protein BJP32_12085 [Brevundimonas sp. ZS04]
MPKNPEDRFGELDELISRLEQKTPKPAAAAAEKPSKAAMPKPVDREQRFRHLIFRLIVAGAFIAYAIWAAFNWQAARPSLPLVLFAFAIAGSIVTFGYDVFFLNLSWNASPPPSTNKGDP